MELVIDRHFRGPTESANGGYTCGVLASLFHGPVEVTLGRDQPTQFVVHRRSGEQDLVQLAIQVVPTSKADRSLSVRARR